MHAVKVKEKLPEWIRSHAVRPWGFVHATVNDPSLECSVNRARQDSTKPARYLHSGEMITPKISDHACAIIPGPGSSAIERTVRTGRRTA
jgi:hypothetical protein